MEPHAGAGRLMEPHAGAGRLMEPTRWYPVPTDDIFIRIMNDNPLAYFITWTVYGAWLQGDERGWRRYRGGHENPQPLLADWRRERLLHPVVLLDEHHRRIVSETIEHHCRLRGWKLWVANPRTNHVHAVVTAMDCSGAKVRDQFKAYCTRLLRVNDTQ